MPKKNINRVEPSTTETSNGSHPHPFAKYLPEVDPTTFPLVHSHARVFPMITMEEMQAMAEDIKTNGLKHPITVVHIIDTTLGQDIEWILDGRNRWVACTMAGVAPVVQDETESLTHSKKQSATLDLVITENLTRRQLTTTEKTLVADQIAMAKQGRRQNGVLTVAEAAKQLKVSASNIGRLRKLRKESPEIYAALQRGEYKHLDAAYKAAGLNKAPAPAAPKKYYVVQNVTGQSGVRHLRADNSKAVGCPSFDTYGEAATYIAAQRAAAVKAEQERRDAENSAGEPEDGTDGKQGPENDIPVPPFHVVESTQGQEWIVADAEGDLLEDFSTEAGAKAKADRWNAEADTEEPPKKTQDDEDIVTEFFDWWRGWTEGLFGSDDTCTAERVTKLVLHHLLTDLFTKDEQEAKQVIATAHQAVKEAKKAQEAQ